MVLANPPAPPNPPALLGVPSSTIFQIHHTLAEIKGLLADLRDITSQASAGQVYPPALVDGLANVNNAAESPIMPRLAPYVVIEALPGSGATSATIVVQDMAPSGALQPVADAAAVVTVSGHAKYVVGSVQQFFKVKASSLTGTWSFLIGFTDTPPLRSGRAVGLFATEQDSASNTGQTLSQAAPPTGLNNYVTSFEVVITGGAAGSDISCVLQDSIGPTTKWKTYIGSAAARGTRVGNNWSFDAPLGPIAGQAQLVVGAGGTGVITSANLQGFVGP